MKLPNKTCQRTKEKSIEILLEFLYTIKNLLPIKDILKTLPSSSINNYIKTQQRQPFGKTAVKELGKDE